MDKATSVRLLELKADLDAKRTVRRKREEVTQHIERDLWSVRTRGTLAPSAALAAYEAGEPPPAAPPGPSEQDLLLAQKGVRAALTADREAEEKARGALQAGVVEALRAEGAAHARAWLEQGQALIRLWQRLAGLSATVGAIVGGGADTAIADPVEWAKFRVPSLPSLRGQDQDLGDVFHTRALFAVEGRQFDQQALAAAGPVEAEIVALLGEWPFTGSVASAGLGPMAAVMRPEPKSSTRRQVLEAAVARSEST